MSRRSSGLAALRNSHETHNHPAPGRIAEQGTVQLNQFRLPPFNWLHPLKSLKQRLQVKQHESDLLDQSLDIDREAYRDRLDQDEKLARHVHRLNLFRSRYEAEDDLAEALIEGQTRVTACAQHYQRLTAINTDNQISLIDELIKDEGTKEKLKTSLRRQAANMFVELEALALNNDANPGNYGVAG